MTDEENVTKDALDMLAKMGYEINEYDRGFIACILTQSNRKCSEGERRKMKAYVTVRDVMLVLPVKDTQARKILHNLRRQKNKKGEIFEGSYRDTMLGKILAVPTPIFVEYFPETKSALNDIWKEQIKSTLGQEC